MKTLPRTVLVVFAVASIVVPFLGTQQAPMPPFSVASVAFPRALPAPVVLLVHGGGWNSRLPIASVDAESLVDAGYVVVTARYTLGTDTRPCGHASVADIAAAIRWVHVQPWAGSVHLYGESAGGTLALLAAHSGYPVESVVAVGAPTDLTVTEPRILVQAIPCFTKTAKELSPLNTVAADGPATLIVHGIQDPIVPVSHATRLAERLRALGVEYTVQILPGGHLPEPEVTQPLVLGWLNEYRSEKR